MKSSTLIFVIIAGLLGLIFSAYILYTAFRIGDISLEYQEGGDKEVINGEQQVIIETDNGEIIVEDAVLSMKGEYEILRSTEEYKIVHLVPENNFQITVYKQPFLTVRKDAEVAFLDALQIDEDVACELDVSVSTPSFVDIEYSGKTYELSFCR